MEKTERILYLECACGISGDMTVGALLDLGADEGVLRKALGSLPVEGFQIKISRVKKAGLDVCDFAVVLDAEHENHDHDMEYLHGHAHAAGGSEEPVRSAHHVHHHRSLPDILHILEHADMSGRAKDTAARIFEILAAAEAKAHGVPKEQVHFHEVGAVDSIADIVAVAVCLDDLHITKAIVPRLCEGQGTIRCQHGILPVPVPAVLNIVQDHQIPLKITDVQGELVTPTGAAIAAAIRMPGCLPDSFTVKRVGMGAGKRAYECPGFLRAMLVETEGKETDTDQICRLEADIDDCTGENLGYAMGRLLEAGAKEVHYSPVYMKKNRPAYELTVLCALEDRSAMEEIIFKETTTIGIRRTYMERTVLKRRLCSVQTPFGEARVKACRWDGKERYYPEYDSVVSLCREHGLDFREGYEAVQRACGENIE